VDLELLITHKIDEHNVLSNYYNYFHLNIED